MSTEQALTYEEDYGEQPYSEFMFDESYGDPMKIKIAEPGSIAINNSTSKYVLFDGPNDEVHIRNFNDINVSTMTLVTTFNGIVRSLDSLFYILPIIHPDEGDRLKRSPGTITSFRWKNKIRGEAGGFFKNAAIIDIWTSKKISTKLSSQKIQMCGPSSVEIGTDASEYLIDHINTSLDFIRDVVENRELFLEAAQWLADHSRGMGVVTDQNIALECNDGYSLSLYDQQMDNYIKWPEDIPPEYEQYVRELIYRCNDLNYVSEIMPLANYFVSLDADAIATELSIVKVGRSMVNYNYHLGFKVNRQALTEIFRYLGIQSDFANTVRAHATVEMYSSIPDDDDIVRRGYYNSKQVFLVYLSGNIMHSGPGGKPMEECYYRFIQLIAYIKNHIKI